MIRARVLRGAGWGRRYFETRATIVSSYAAEQHLLHFGRSHVPVCWTICGLTGGYVIELNG